MSGFVLPPQFYDISWDQLPEPEAPGGLEFSELQNRKDWVVKLSFTQQGDPNNGTGFYVNIPDSRFHVILTAGHNLIDGKGVRSQNLVILGPDSTKEKVESGQLFISETYHQFPKSSAEFDYGAILVSKLASTTARGFGFSLKLGHDNLRGADLNVSGYRATTEPGQPVTSTGKCLISRKNQLEYEVSTEQGLSGSPVFTAYKGHEVAIAIHNNGPERPGRGSRGSRLNETILGDIFKWANVGYENKSLKVSSKTAPKEGLYLRFMPELDHAWVRVGSKGLETSFDVFPAYAPTPAMANTPLYVFRFRQPMEWPDERKAHRWVLWNTIRQRVTLTDALHEFCFVRIVPPGKRKQETQATFTFQVVMANLRDKGGQGSAVGELVDLRMQAAEILEEDIAMGEPDTPEVSFGVHRKGKKVDFNVFCFQ